MIFPKNIELITNRLESKGYKTYLVGGCVRDYLLDLPIHDYDLVTQAEPDEIIENFKDFRILEIGKTFGIIEIIINNEKYQIATMRKDEKYSDNRHPDKVTYTKNIEVDLARRDFTMNAIAYHIKSDVYIDPFNGESDINNKVIRCVGNPDKRFKEDALRMLRCFRFHAEKKLEIESDTLYSIINNKSLIENISKERITEEINKILISDHPHYIDSVFRYGLGDYIFPELYAMKLVDQNNPYHIYNVWDHTMTSLKAVKNDLNLRLTILLHDVGKCLTKTKDEDGFDHFLNHPKYSELYAREVLKNLKYDNNTIEKVCTLILHHDYDRNLSKKSVRKMLNKLGEENFYDLLEINRADILGQSLKYSKRILDLKKIKILAKEILDSKECFSLKDLAINGNDLIELGFNQDKSIGETLNNLLMLVIEDSNYNNKEILIELAKNILNK